MFDTHTLSEWARHGRRLTHCGIVVRGSENGMHYAADGGERVLVTPHANYCLPHQRCAACREHRARGTVGGITLA